MHRNDSNASYALWLRGFATLWAVLLLAAAFSARPAEASHFAFVTNVDANKFWLVDTATDKVVATFPRDAPNLRAVSLDGKYAYTVEESSNHVLVTATATGNVVKKVRVGKAPYGVAVSLDGKHVFVLNRISDTFSVIDTASNTVVETVPGETEHFGVLIAPDGKHLEFVK